MRKERQQAVRVLSVYGCVRKEVEKAKRLDRRAWRGRIGLSGSLRSGVRAQIAGDL